MKKIKFILIGLLGFAACKSSSDEALVKGQVKNMPDGDIYFIRSSDEEHIDTVQVKDGKFEWKTKVQEPTVYMINFGANQQPAFMILESGETKISYVADSLNSIDIQGGKEQDLYNTFIKTCKPVFSSMDSLGQLAVANEENVALLQELQTEFFKLDAVIKEKQINFVKANNESVAATFVAVNYLNEKMDKTAADAENMLSLLGPKARETFYGKRIAELLKQLKGTSVGQPAPDFTLNDPSGKAISLSAYKGKFVLIDFWASWCGPCRGENPNVVAAYEKYHGKGLEILAVSLDEQKDKWMSAIEKDGLSWTHVSDLQGWNSPAAALYGVQSIPANFLLDKEGKIIAKDLRGNALHETLEQVLGAQ